MTVYQELQLSSAGSKNLIRRSENKKEKKRHIFIYNAKVYLVVAFCFAVVTAFSLLFGSANSIAGVVVLLALLVLRQADFGIRTSHGLICIGLIFGVLIAGPRLSNMLPPGYAFFANCIFIMILMVLGCHNVIMSNHSTFVLSYLLLQGYDVSGAVMKNVSWDCFWEWSSAWLYFIKIRDCVRTAEAFWICSGNSISVRQETGGISV